MTILVLIISIIIYCLAFYGALPTNISLFRRFDLLIRSIFFMLLIGRIGGLFYKFGSIATEWGFAPIIINQNSVEIFGRLPWIIFRVWDSNWYFPGFLFSAVFGFLLAYFFGDKSLKLTGQVINNVIISIFVAQTLVLGLNLIFGTTVIWGQLSLFGLDFVETQLVINIIILVMCGILHFVYKINKLAPFALFVFGFTNLVFSIVVDMLHPNFIVMNINYIETGMLIITSVIIFLYTYIHSILAPISTEGLLLNNRIGARKLSDSQLSQKSWKPRKWN